MGLYTSKEKNTAFMRYIDDGSWAVCNICHRGLTDNNIDTILEKYEECKCLDDMLENVTLSGDGEFEVFSFFGPTISLEKFMLLTHDLLEWKRLEAIKITDTK
jgi:hypothetical protein